MGFKIKAKELMSEIRLFDTHCHSHDTVRCHKRIRSVPIDQMVLMGVHSDNWKLMLNAHQLSPENTMIGFGVHPWFTHNFIQDPSDDAEVNSESDQNEKL